MLALKLILIALLLWSEIPDVSAQPVVRLGYSGAGVAQSLYNVIKTAGLWQKYNLDVRPVYFNSGSLTAQAVVGGDIDLTDSNIPTMLNLKVAGLLDVRVVAVWMNRIPLAFIARKGIRIAELKGKRLAISRFGSSSDFITRLLLKYWKLDPDKDVVIIQSGGNDALRIAALVAGHSDAALIGSYDVPKILASGCCVNLADLDDLPIEYARFGVVVPTASLRTKRDILRRYLQALTEGIYVYKTRAEIPIRVLSKEGIQNPEAAYKQIIKSLISNPVPDEKSVQVALDSIGTPKSRGLRATDFIDASLIEELGKSGFVDNLYRK